MNSNRPKMGRPPLDLTGRVFGRLTVKQKAPCYVQSNRRRITRWECVCVCGKIKITRTNTLTKGEVVSCGCVREEYRKTILPKHGVIHGYSRYREYRVWKNMIKRCVNPDHGSYGTYGGRGIQVCDRWMESFEDFLEDMGLCPSGFSLERIDNEGSYCRSNCKWASAKEQGNNRRNNRICVFKGETDTLTNLCRKHAVVSLNVARNRFYTGWSLEKALLTPLMYSRI